VRVILLIAGLALSLSSCGDDDATRQVARDIRVEELSVRGPHSVWVTIVTGGQKGTYEVAVHGRALSVRQTVTLSTDPDTAYTLEGYSRCLVVTLPGNVPSSTLRRVISPFPDQPPYRRNCIPVTATAELPPLGNRDNGLAAHLDSAR
jgi:hypothetical protein